MSSQRKLNALLFELQTAASPLAQAKILARSWRTLRELSATDRRLLARHTGFDGAEQILEGLARKQGGFAPATLLQVLNRARNTDGAAVTNLLAAIRDPSRRDEALTRGADLAAELLGENAGEDDPQEIDEALDQLHAVEKDESGPVAEALARPDERGAATLKAAPPPLPPVPAPANPEVPEADDRSGLQNVEVLPTETSPPTRNPPKAPQPVARPAPKRVAPSAGWDRLGTGAEQTRAQPEPAVEIEPLPGATGVSRFDALAVFAALESESSSMARLRALDREMESFRGVSPLTIREILDGFPDGWVRRRALLALISAGVPASATQALRLIAGLDREVDRRWCLGALAKRGDLKGEILERSLELVASPAGRRRLQIIAERA